VTPVLLAHLFLTKPSYIFASSSNALTSPLPANAAQSPLMSLTKASMNYESIKS